MTKSRIIMKHMFHDAKDQDFEYEVDSVAKTLNVYVDAIDVVLLKSFIYDVVAEHIADDDRVDDYKITLIVCNQLSLNVALKRSEWQKSEDTVVLSRHCVLGEVSL